MKRELKFEAFIPELGIMLEEVTIYREGIIGLDIDSLATSLEELSTEEFVYTVSDEYIQRHNTTLDEYEVIVSILSGEDWIFFEKAIIRQFTGLLDKNGKEIYEGDILNFLDGCVESTESGYQVNEEWSVGIIEWCQDELRWDITNRLSIEMDEFDELGIEVIGNIYKNPELIKK